MLLASVLIAGPNGSCCECLALDQKRWFEYGSAGPRRFLDEI
jgi:hypothetical protein